MQLNMEYGRWQLHMQHAVHDRHDRHDRRHAVVRPSAHSDPMYMASVRRVGWQRATSSACLTGALSEWTFL
jgi:hypothetical protein